MIKKRILLKLKFRSLALKDFILNVFYNNFIPKQQALPLSALMQSMQPDLPSEEIVQIEDVQIIPVEADSVLVFLFGLARSVFGIYGCFSRSRYDQHEISEDTSEPSEEEIKLLYETFYESQMNNLMDKQEIHQLQVRHPFEKLPQNYKVQDGQFYFDEKQLPEKPVDENQQEQSSSYQDINSIIIQGHSEMRKNNWAAGPRTSKKHQHHIQLFIKFWTDHNWHKNFKDSTLKEIKKLTEERKQKEQQKSYAQIVQEIVEKLYKDTDKIKRKFKISVPKTKGIAKKEKKNEQRKIKIKQEISESQDQKDPKQIPKSEYIKTVFNQTEQKFVRQLFENIKLRYFKIMFGYLKRESEKRSLESITSLLLLDQTGEKQMKGAFDLQFEELEKKQGFQKDGLKQLKENMIDLIGKNGVQNQRETQQRLKLRLRQQREQKILQKLQKQESSNTGVDFGTDSYLQWEESLNFKIPQINQQTEETEQMQPNHTEQRDQVQRISFKQTTKVDEIEQKQEEDDDSNEDDEEDKSFSIMLDNKISKLEQNEKEEESKMKEGKTNAKSLCTWLKNTLRAIRQNINLEQNQAPEQQDNNETQETGQKDSVQQTKLQSNPENQESELKTESQGKQKQKESQDEASPVNNLSGKIE